MLSQVKSSKELLEEARAIASAGTKKGSRRKRKTTVASDTTDEERLPSGQMVGVDGSLHSFDNVNLYFIANLLFLFYMSPTHGYFGLRTLYFLHPSLLSFLSTTR